MQLGPHAQNMSAEFSCPMNYTKKSAPGPHAHGSHSDTAGTCHSASYLSQISAPGWLTSSDMSPGLLHPPTAANDQRSDSGRERLGYLFPTSLLLFLQGRAWWWLSSFPKATAPTGLRVLRSPGPPVSSPNPAHASVLRLFINHFFSKPSEASHLLLGP